MASRSGGSSGRKLFVWSRGLTFATANLLWDFCCCKITLQHARAHTQRRPTGTAAGRIDLVFSEAVAIAIALDSHQAVARLERSRAAYYISSRQKDPHNYTQHRSLLSPPLLSRLD